MYLGHAWEVLRGEFERLLDSFRGVFSGQTTCIKPIRSYSHLDKKKFFLGGGSCSAGSFLIFLVEILVVLVVGLVVLGVVVEHVHLGS